MTSPRVFHDAMAVRWARARLVGAWPALVLALNGGAVLRAEEIVTLDTMEVTGRRPEPAPGDATVAMTAYQGSFLEANGIVGYENLARIVPGLFVTEQSADNVSLNVRGLTSDTGDPRISPRVSVFQDGVLLHNIRAQGVALFDVDEASVFKGPQSARFGRGVEAGALSFTSNRAVNESTGTLEAGFGDYGAVSSGVTINRPVVEDEVFARVAVYQNLRDGYVDNLADGSDLQGEGTVALRTSLRWQPAATTSVDLIFHYQEDDTPGVAQKSMRGVPGLPPVADTDPYTAANLNRGSELGVTRTLLGLTGIFDAKLNDAWTLTGTGAWRDVESRQEFDADGSYHYLLEGGDRFHGSQLSQEVRLDYDRGERLTASVGVGVSQSRDEQNATVRTDENALWRFVTGTPPAVALNTDYHERFANQAETRSGDIFGRADYKFTERLTLGGEARLTRERIVSRYRSYAAPVPGNVVGVVPTSGGVNNFIRNTPGWLENSADEDSWSGKLDAHFAFTPRFATYAGVSRGRHAPVLTHDAITFAPLTTAEETVWNHEVGVKGASAKRRLRYDASVFYYRFEHFQTQRVVAPGVVAPYDGGRAAGRGAEVAVEADVGRALTVFATYGFTDAGFSGLDEDGAPQLYAGDSFRLTSRHVVSLGGTATLPFGERGVVFVTPLLTYRSEYFFEDNNAQNGGILRQDGFLLANLRLGYRPRDGRWEIAGYVNNLFDKEYLLDAGNIGGAYGIPTATRAAPRMVGVKASARF